MSRPCNDPGERNPQVVFTNDEGKKIVVYVELARTSQEHAQGLMYRRALKDDQGMLFIFPSETIQSFWMKNTYIPLDMIHINNNLEVVGIVENARPHDTSPHVVGRPARFVLEVNAFFARQHQIHAGQKVQFIDVAY